MVRAGTLFKKEHAMAARRIIIDTDPGRTMSWRSCPRWRLARLV